MKKTKVLISVIMILGFAFTASAQQDTIQNKTAQENVTDGLAKRFGLYVFPTNNQDQKIQDADEMACYRWAVEQSGFDPLNPTKVEAGQAYRGPDGSAVAGAAGGAAAGAAIGAIAGDAGKGAAIGAVAGAMRGRRASAVSSHAQQQQMNQAAAAKEKELMDGFKKAFSACMEGKSYTVR
jgi:hypothetical protein